MQLEAHIWPGSIRKHMTLLVWWTLGLPLFGVVRRFCNIFLFLLGMPAIHFYGQEIHNIRRALIQQGSFHVFNWVTSFNISSCTLLDPRWCFLQVIPFLGGRISTSHFPKSLLDSLFTSNPIIMECYLQEEFLKSAISFQIQTLADNFT